ncbi:hypothetical protein Tco_1090920 [Tanacetum coccineum]|uniref:Uncharacterized protein n=1 Tax=Tanacetum coccineum TaxID=301880 RepID=A0ABQ5I5L5_9ASTR
MSRNISEEFSEYINCPSWDRPLFYNNDDDEYTKIWRRPKAITPEEPVVSLIIRDEHLGTIPEKESGTINKSLELQLSKIPLSLFPKKGRPNLDHFSSPRPPPKPPDVEICFDFEPDTVVKNNFDELNDDDYFDPGGGEIVVSQNVEDDDSFTFVIWTFIPFLTYSEVSPLPSSTKNEDTIFDPGISTQDRWPLIGMELSCALMFVQTLMKA